MCFGLNDAAPPHSGSLNSGEEVENLTCASGSNLEAATRRGPKIGGIILDNPFILAPLAGITNWPFRLLAKEAGAGLTVSEMASATALSFRGKATLRLLDSDPQVESPFCVQLFGKDPDTMAEAAKVAVANGAHMIDFNMGCPARKVIGSGHGSSLLKDLPLVKRILRAMRKAVSVPLTVKTRPAFAPGVGGSVFDLLPVLLDEGIDAVTLHPRMTSEGFSGQADWSIVDRLVEQSPIPVIGSGDISNAAEAVRRLYKHKVAAVMIGRAAKGRPWLFRQCLELWRSGQMPQENLGIPAAELDLMEISLEERLHTAARHARLLGEYVGSKAPFMLRTVLMWYTKGLHGSSEFRARICREENLDTQLELLTQCIERHRQFSSQQDGNSAGLDDA